MYLFVYIYTYFLPVLNVAFVSFFLIHFIPLSGSFPVFPVFSFGCRQFRRIPIDTSSLFFTGIQVKVVFLFRLVDYIIAVASERMNPAQRPVIAGGQLRVPHLLFLLDFLNVVVSCFVADPANLVLKNHVVFSPEVSIVSGDNEILLLKQNWGNELNYAPSFKM